MSYRKPFVVPRIGESLDGARLVNWLVEPGQSFRAEDMLLELETDKSVVEVPAGEAGVLVERLLGKGDVLQPDSPVAWIEVEGEAPPEQPGDASGPAGGEAAGEAVGTAAGTAADQAAAAEPARPAAAAARAPGRRVAVTPAARQLAARLGVDAARVLGSGPGGRVVRADVAAAAIARPAGDTAAWQAGMERLDLATSAGALHALRCAAAAEGPAPTLVLLHGLFGDLDTWAGTIVSARRAGLGVVALDLPGHGRSQASARSFGELVDTVAQALPALGDGPLALVGHSLGAALATRIAGRLGQRLRSLTLFAPLGLGTEINQSFVDGMLHAASDEALAREVGKLTAQRTLPSAGYLGELRQRLAARGEALAQLCASVSRHGVQQIDVLPELQALAAPVSIVHGRDDEIIAWQHALRAPARVALHLVPGVGHMPQVEAMAVAWEVLQRALRA